MRRYAPALWAATSAALLALMLAPVFGTPTRAAPAANITGTPTEAPTNTPVPPTETPVPGAPTNTPLPGGPTETPLPGGPTNTPVPGAPTNTPVPGVPTETPVPTSTGGVLPPPPPEDDDDSPRETPDVAVFKQVDDDSVKPGDELTYTINVINRGTGGATDVVVTDTMPEGTEILGVSASRGDVSQSGRSVTVTIGNLGAGETVTVVIRARVTAPAASSTLRNNAAAESGNGAQRLRVETSVDVSLELTPTPELTPLPRSAPLPQQAPQGNARLPRTGTLFADVSDFAVLMVLAAAALFSLSMAARSYVGRRRS